jgi:hypothetical protein
MIHRLSWFKRTSVFPRRTDEAGVFQLLTNKDSLS